MTSPWVEYSLAGISLFPLSGLLIAEKKLFLPHLGRLYTLIATVFSLAVYLWIQWLFESQGCLPSAIPFWLSLILALVFLWLYLWIIFKYRRGHIDAQGRERPGSAKKKPGYVLLSLPLYILFIASLTHSYNILETLTEYRVIRGSVSAAKAVTHRPVTIQFSLEGAKKETHLSKKNGRFCIILPKTRYRKIHTVIFRLQQNNRLYRAARDIQDLPLNQKWHIILHPSPEE